MNSVPKSGFKRSVARIAQFQPFGSGEVRVEFSRRAFVLAAAYENGGRLASLADCRDVCDGLWGLELDIDEIRDVVESLAGRGDLDEDEGGYRLTEKATRELADRTQTSAEAESQAFADWELSVAALDATLTPEQIADLRKDLEKWLQEIVTKHGVEAALILYPEHERAQDLIDSVQSLGFDFLPERDDCIEQVRPKALFAFIHKATPAQRTYLANLFTTAYMVAVFTLDPEASEAVRALTQGQRVYLDTNVIYAILNLSGPRAFLSARRVLELTRKLGYEICVTPWTVAEMRKSVRLAREKLSKTTLPPRALAEIAAEASGDETFVTAYWRKFKETGVKPNDFLDFHDQIEGLLDQAGIQVEDEACLAVDRDSDELAAQMGLLESVPGGANKSGGIKEHDAKHRMLIERLRGQGHRRFSNAGYWFITRDSVLIPYASEGRAAPDSLPFAVSFPSWAQIVRSLSPRTEDYEQTLVDLLDTPAVRPRGMVSYETVAEVLGRIEMLVEDSSEEIATRMLLDGAVMQEVENRTGDRSEFIDTAVGEKKNELEKQLQDTQAQIASERAARLAAEQKASNEEAARLRQKRMAEEAAADAMTARAATVAAEARAAAVQAEASEIEEEERKNSMRSKSEIGALKGQIDFQGKMVKGLIAALVMLLVAAAIAVTLALEWVTDGWLLVGLILVGGSLMMAPIAWLLGRKKAGAILGSIALALGLVSALYDLVSADDADKARLSGSSQKTSTGGVGEGSATDRGRRDQLP
jgi:hypothetical protein